MQRLHPSWTKSSTLKRSQKLTGRQWVAAGPAVTFPLLSLWDEGGISIFELLTLLNCYHKQVHRELHKAQECRRADSSAKHVPFRKKSSNLSLKGWRCSSGDSLKTTFICFSQTVRTQVQCWSFKKPFYINGNNTEIFSRSGYFTLNSAWRNR